MTVIKCKMCGGDLVLSEGSSIATCEYCDSVQTVPSADNEKKLTLFSRANRLRAACEFDKAAGIYESIVADFSDEAEAYWGLVLCKYGIEYVDDPATGKKIPTCHRSSYDSVMDDGNFEQAMENADVLAQKLYREEAKQIERIRKGILEVSSSEQPYDIFICYKETAENGDRTLDSVLAQDLYSALTDKGYRVFFSRITLQGKLGEAYEPYIFAALNSAKVMLAVGTCYEYYNAVWVKNEWSRYLKICEGDKSKHLIPCFKDLDPEDMPKEFSHLQGADLGKMGAIQDVLFNMEKYIPLKKQTVVQETVVVGSAAGNKVAVLLERGNMALEDGDWKKADEFFEETLNNDAKNAAAYIGKLLAKEQSVSLDALAAKRLKTFSEQLGTTATMNVPADHVDYIVAQYSISGFLADTKLRALYKNKYEYNSLTGVYKTICDMEKMFWNMNRQLDRALQFAQEKEKKQIEDTRSYVMSQLDAKMREAENYDREQKARIRASWTKLDESAAQMHREACERREERYQYWVQTAENETNPEELQTLASRFAGLARYRDSVAWMQRCRQRYTELNAEQQRREAEVRAKEEAEAERRRIAAEKEENARKMKKRILLAAVALIVIAIVIVTKTVIPNNKYNLALSLMQEGQYETAAYEFEDLGKYKDSHDLYQECLYRHAQQLYSDRSYETALGAFEKIQEYKDSADYYSKLPKLILVEDYRKAQIGDTVTMGTYKDGRPNNYELKSIEWIVLDIQDDKMLLLAKGYLADRSYHDVLLGYPSWETCALRTWLNNDFVNNSFSELEQELILMSDISAEPNPQYGTTGGADTQDRLFILSYSEVMEFLPETADREYDGQAWWLRTSGADQEKAMCVNEDGTINMDGRGVFLSTSNGACPRPAMWIDLNNAP